jgi:hypothetical protein
MIGYQYFTEQEAIEARQKCADFYRLPLSEESVTKYYVDYNYSELDEFYYIVWVNGCTEVLGEPIEFEINYGFGEPQEFEI